MTVPIHLDILERNRGARICQSDMPEPPPPPAKVQSGRVRLAATSVLVQPRLWDDDQTVTAGPWTIGPTLQSKQVAKLHHRPVPMPGYEGAMFVHAQDGL